MPPACFLSAHMLIYRKMPGDEEKIKVVAEKDPEASLRAEKLRNFKDEIQELQEKEREAEREAVLENRKSTEPGHFANPDLNVDELTEEDMAIWGKIKDESLTWEDYEKYRSAFLAAGIFKREEMKMPSRAHFYDAVGNRANRILVRKPRTHAGN